MSRLALLDQASTVAFAGDWHGQYHHGVRVIDSLAGKVDVLIHVGDFGWRFEPDFLHYIQLAASEAEMTVIFVDGNHEDFGWLLAQPLDDEGIRPLEDNLWHMPRGLRWTMLHGLVSFLALGGAHSVNRKDLLATGEWWPEERITIGEAMLASAGGPIDVIVSHEAPALSPVPGLDKPSGWPAEELKSSASQRDLVQSVVNATRARFLWHGHHHVRYSAVLPSGTQVTGLAHENRTQDNIQLVHLIDLVAQ